MWNSEREKSLKYPVEHIRRINKLPTLKIKKTVTSSRTPFYYRLHYDIFQYQSFECGDYQTRALYGVEKWNWLPIHIPTWGFFIASSNMYSCGARSNTWLCVITQSETSSVNYIHPVLPYDWPYTFFTYKRIYVTIYIFLFTYINKQLKTKTTLRSRSKQINPCEISPL